MSPHVSNETVAALVRRELERDPSEIERVHGQGHVNAIFYVRADDDVLVARVNEAANLAQFRKEAWCLERAEAASVPGPRVLALGVDGPLSYMFESYVPGEHGASVAQAEAVWEALGDYARRIHSITVEGFGDAMIAPGRFGGDWRAHLTYNLEALSPSDELLRRGLIDAPLQRRLRERLRQLDRTQLRIGLCHGDLSLKNTVVESGRVTLLDWGSAEAHVVPHLDLLEALKSSFRLDAEAMGFGALLRGYGLDVGDFTALRPELEALLCLRALDKLRWALDRRPDRVEHYSVYLRDVLAFVALD